MVAEAGARAGPTSAGRRALSVSPFVPSRSAPYAGHRFYFEYLWRLSQVFDVTLVAPDNDENRRRSDGAGPWRTALVPARAKPGGWLGELATLSLQGREVPVPGAVDVVRSCDIAPQVVELQWSASMSLAPALRNAFPSAYVAAFQHDRYSGTLSWARRSHLTLRGRLRDALASRTTALQERKLAAYCDLLVAFKAEDISFVRPGAPVRGSHRGRTRTAVVIDPWLDPAPERAPADDREDVLFVAAFDRAENVAGAAWLLDHVWPLVMERFPHARLVLAGGNPAPSLVERSGPSVLVTGFVADPEPFYAAAHCFVAPVFGGGGLRFKVPQAMVAGIPLVATHEALAGLEGVPSSGLAGVSSDPKEFAAAICRVLAEPERAAHQAKAAQVWASERFSFERQVARVMERYCGVSAAFGRAR
ncbi:MAG: glycosyltransferase [Acidimicrobiales bacterium]